MRVVVGSFIYVERRKGDYYNRVVSNKAFELSIKQIWGFEETSVPSLWALMMRPSILCGNILPATSVERSRSIFAPLTLAMGGAIYLLHT